MVRRCVAILGIATALICVSSPMASAVTLPCNAAFAYAGQMTSTTAGESACPNYGYFGYVGIDGQIQTPGALPSGLSVDDRALGYLNASFNNYQAWLQVGWMAGYLGDSSSSISSYDAYRLYFEQLYPSGFYYVKNVSGLGYGGKVTYRIDYAGNGCWKTFYNYNVQTDYSCSYPASSLMSASSETGNGGTGSFSSMPRSWFGVAASNTNQTLRLRGSTGWHDWVNDTTWVTQYRPYFYWSPAATYTHFTTVGSTQ